jgi:hypothetical protein
MKGFFAAILMLPISCFADSIHFNDGALEDVYIVEGKAHYYVSNPLDGSTKSIRKSATENVTLSTNPLEREQLKQRWHEARGDNTEPRNLNALAEYLSNRPKYPLIEAKGTRRASAQQTAQARANVQRIKQRAQKINPRVTSRQALPLQGGNQTSGAATNGGGNGGGNVTFTNISQLFSTIDDRLVGEFPNLITQNTQGGQGGQGAQGGLAALMGQP